MCQGSDDSRKAWQLQNVSCNFTHLRLCNFGDGRKEQDASYQVKIRPFGTLDSLHMVPYDFQKHIRANGMTHKYDLWDSSSFLDMFIENVLLVFDLIIEIGGLFKVGGINSLFKSFIRVAANNEVSFARV